jgi:methylated-DNA-[protein]-cysteine S-methyltransferase
MKISLVEYYYSAHPLGYLVYTLNSAGLLSTTEFRDTIPVDSIPSLSVFSTAFDAYFQEKKDFPLHLLSQNLRGTEFQRAVWKVISEIPFGQVITYSELARRAGKPGAARAAGTACGKNPVALAIPCHRVVRTSGEDYGYSWGFERKKWLLEFEGLRL